MKDTPFRLQLKVRKDLSFCFGPSTIAGTSTIVAAHQDYAAPICTIWYRTVGRSTLDILGMYSPSQCRKCGVAGWLFEKLIKYYPEVRRIVTASDTRYSRHWLQQRGFVRDESGDLVMDVKAQLAKFKPKEAKK